METHYTVLQVEDNPGDARLLHKIVKTIPNAPFDLIAVDRLAAGLARLSAGGIDAVLLDLSLPESTGLETLARVHAHAPAVPIIVLTGLDDEDVGAEALRAGAQDFLVKGQVDYPLLARSIRYAIERKRAEEALRASEERFRTVERITGYRVEEFTGNPRLLEIIVHPDDQAALIQHLREHLASDDAAALDFRIIRRDGELRWINHLCQMVRGADGRCLGRRSSNRDITDRKRAEEALRESEERYRLLAENALVGIIVAQDAVIRYANPHALGLAGYSQEELASMAFAPLIHPDDQETTIGYYLRFLQVRKRLPIMLSELLTKQGASSGWRVTPS